MAPRSLQSDWLQLAAALERDGQRPDLAVLRAAFYAGASTALAALLADFPAGAGLADTHAELIRRLQVLGREAMIEGMQRPDNLS